MSESILFIVESADRPTPYDEDDPAQWLERALRDAGEGTHVLLKRDAVSYALRGAAGPTPWPRVERDLARLRAKGATVYVLEEDLAVRGIQGDELVAGITRLRGSQVPALLREHERVWQW